MSQRGFLFLCLNSLFFLLTLCMADHAFSRQNFSCLSEIRKEDQLASARAQNALWGPPFFFLPGVLSSLLPSIPPIRLLCNSILLCAVSVLYSSCRTRGRAVQIRNGAGTGAFPRSVDNAAGRDTGALPRS